MKWLTINSVLLYDLMIQTRNSLFILEYLQSRIIYYGVFLFLLDNI